MCQSKTFSDSLPTTIGSDSDTRPVGMRIAWFSVNNNATLVAFTLKPMKASLYDSRIFIWHATTERVQWLDLKNGEQQPATEDAVESDAKDRKPSDTQGSVLDT